MKRIPALLAVTVATALTLTACGSSDSGDQNTGSSNPQASSSEASADFNDADVTFAKSMIPHHQQAVQMAEMAKTHAASSQVKQLAADIEAAQGPEIKTMQGWLSAWGSGDSSESSEGGDNGHGDMGHGDMNMGNMDMGDMPGMMSKSDMHALSQAHGKAWDRMFLEMMIRHHEGAIEMAKTEQSDGKNPGAVALAKKIETAQQAEISKMKGMLG